MYKRQWTIRFSSFFKTISTEKLIVFLPCSPTSKDMQRENQKDVKETIPGLRFYPTEDELVSFYLHNMLEEKRLHDLSRVIPVINIYELEPWQLPELAGELCSGDTEQWFFFVPRQEREARGGRPNRTTALGYWKATGSPSYVYSSDNRVIGVKKSLVYYNGKAPTGSKTKWKMNEYRAIKEEMPTSSARAIPKLRHELSLCRVYIVSGIFRAFDRRPVVIESSRDVVAQENVGSHSTKVTERSTSPKEVLVDHVEKEGINWEMDTGLRSLWEGGQFNQMQVPQNKN